jgi:hypothetical protein
MYKEKEMLDTLEWSPHMVHTHEIITSDPISMDNYMPIKNTKNGKDQIKHFFNWKNMWWPHPIVPLRGREGEGAHLTMVCTLTTAPSRDAVGLAVAGLSLSLPPSTCRSIACSAFCTPHQKSQLLALPSWLQSHEDDPTFWTSGPTSTELA